MNNLFTQNYEECKPLAYAMRPKSLDEFKGQDQLLARGGLLRELIDKNKLSSMLIFGPPGCGKSSIGELISKQLAYDFYQLNATTASINDIKELVNKAKQAIEYKQKKSILFLDEIHRFNKTQQDALLSYLEKGLIILIAASTQNPYYTLNNALLSRLLIFEFKPLSCDDLKAIIKNAALKSELLISKEMINIIVDISLGDARVALNHLQLYKDLQGLDEEKIKDQFKKRSFSYDKKEDKYDLISAFIKSLRHSDVDSSLYWMGRMLIGGEDPSYIARRMMIFASEDIGLANSNALLLANTAMQAASNIAMPELKIIFSQVAIFLALSPKSNSSYKAINKVYKAIQSGDITKIPPWLKTGSKSYKNPHLYKGKVLKQSYGRQRGSFYEADLNEAEMRLQKWLRELEKYL